MTLEQKLQLYRLNRSEYDRIEALLGRPPQGLEWPLFSALWSEHCSYKSSRVHLKKFFNRNERVVTGPGENAGIIDLGEGEKIAFKMESHNHPSFIEPYEGAATGVGGILRDIFTMGARPIALANYLCFGDPKASRMRSLVDGVVRGIGGYGNCVGVPTVTGQTEFHHSYNQNILVNAMAVGYFGPGEEPITAAAKGPGNLVVYVGAKTGRDGIHGASMASESFDGDSEAKRPTVQKGDPFYEKLLIEACLEVMHQGLVESIQDMGAAGLTSSSFEMAARGHVGLNLDLSKVPLRDLSLTPEDILLSESQERMLLVCLPKNFAEIKKIFEHWDLDAVVIGEVLKDKNINLIWHGEVLCQIDPSLLTENSPQYERPYDNWSAKNKSEKLVAESINPKQLNSSLLKQLESIFGTSREWIYQQFDQRVGARTVCDASSSLSVIKLPSSGRALGIVLGARPYVMRMDARIGGMDSIAYPALQLAAKGFLPLAVTDCLNFGNPENRNIMSEFVASLDGMNSLCKAINTPVISGNVSFYNETQGKNITSTPSTGLLGLRDQITGIPSDQFQAAGEKIILISAAFLTTDGQSAEMNGTEARFQGDLDPKQIQDFVHAVRQLGLAKPVRASQVVGKFGLPYQLARMSMGPFSANIKDQKFASTNEVFYQVVFSINPAELGFFKDLFGQLNTSLAWSFEVIGETQAGDFILGSSHWDKGQLLKAYQSGWSNHLGFS